MRPDSSAIANALIAKLGADATLLALVPNGVYEDMAPPAAQRFVIVSQLIAQDAGMHAKGRAIEDTLFLVEARVLYGAPGGNSQTAAQAAARIDELLEDGTLTVPGYIHMAMSREEMVRGTEVDEVDPSIVWKRRGGRYRVQMFRTLRPALQTVLSGNTSAGPGAILAINVFFDRPVQLRGAAPITLTVQSSNPALRPDQTLAFDLEASTLDLPDYPTYGRALLVFDLEHLDLTGCAGLSFTVSDASSRAGWDQIRDQQTSEPVLDTLGNFSAVIQVE